MTTGSIAGAIGTSALADRPRALAISTVSFALYVCSAYVPLMIQVRGDPPHCSGDAGVGVHHPARRLRVNCRGMRSQRTLPDDPFTIL